MLSIILPNILTTLLLLLLVCFRYRKNHSLIEPGIIFSLNLILLYPVRAIVIFFFGKQSFPEFDALLLIAVLANLSWMALMGSIGYVVGYYLVTSKRYFSILKKDSRTYGSNELFV